MPLRRTLPPLPSLPGLALSALVTSILATSMLATSILTLPPLAGTARAAETRSYTAEAFEAAQAAGKPIVLAVSAPWCPICKAQKPILAKLREQARFGDLVIFEVDFDTRKDVLRTFDTRMQSTLVAFKGRTEVGRSVGETQPEWIETLVEKTL